MIQNNVLLYVAKIINGSLAATGAGDVEEGVVRRGMALLLNLLTESKTFDVLEGNEDKIVEQILEACCLTMESSTLKGKQPTVAEEGMHLQQCMA